MCGIVGYVGARQATLILVNGLRKLEYRGYDSAGVAVWNDGQSRVVRCRGKLAALEEKLIKEPAPGSTGIGHTRWATHGRPSDENAHPHKVGSISVIHNGIIENHLALRQELAAGGSKFTSETDTELFAHLVEREVRKGTTDLTAAVRAALAKVHGAYAFVVMNDKDPSTLVAAKNASPMVVGLGDGENFIASDVTAILSETRKIIFVEEGEIVTVTRDKVTLSDFDGKPRTREPKTITWSATQAEKAGFKHYMLKEIHEQPESLQRCLSGRVYLEQGGAKLGGLELEPRDIALVRRVGILGCGTSYHAALVGAHAMEQLARIPAFAEIGSEYRYRNPVVSPDDLYFAVSQSGETIDTLGAVNEIKTKGGRVMGVVNVVGSSIARACGRGVYVHSGPEIAVASTKAFTSQVAGLLVASLMFARTRTLGPHEGRAFGEELLAIPERVRAYLADPGPIHDAVDLLVRGKFVFFLGRGPSAAVAMEGALKLKEVAYVPCMSYPAAEMKHGPIALIDPHTPVVAIVPDDEMRDKTLSNVQEVRARGARTILVHSEGDTDAPRLADVAIAVPRTRSSLTSPLLTVLPLQLFAYRAGLALGRDIDRPRNLAKSVTVE